MTEANKDIAVEVKRDFSAGDTVSGEVVEVFAATRNSDLNEGRGPRVDHSYYLTAYDATIGAHKIDMGGADGWVEPRLALRLSSGAYYLLPQFISISRIAPATAAEIRKAAESKLTRAELAIIKGTV